MTSTLAERAPSRRKLTLVGSSIVALAAAINLGLGAGAANAGTVGTFSQQHVDAVHISLAPTSNKLILGTNREEATVAPVDGYYTGSEVNATSSLSVPAYDFTVKKYTSGTTTIWQIPKSEATANARGVVWAGFAGLGNTSDASTRYLQKHGTTSPNVARSLFYGGGYATVPTSAKIRTTITLVSKPSGSNATLNWSGVAGVTASGSGSSASPYLVDFALASNQEEAFHRHPQWDFTKAGTYVFKVVASVNGSSSIAASDPVYYRFVATS